MIKTFTVQHFLQYLVGGDTQRELNMHYQVPQSSDCFTTTRLVSSSNGDFLHGDQMGFLLYSRKKKKSSLKKTVDQCLLSTHEVPGPSPIPHKTGWSGPVIPEPVAWR